MSCHLPKTFFLKFCIGILILAAPAGTGCLRSLAADAAEPGVATNRADDSQESLRAYLQLQEQLHATRLELEQTRKENEQTAVENARALASRLEAIEKALAAQRARDLEAMQSSNRAMFIIAGTFAALGFVAMLMMAYFQWRTVNGIAQISAALPPLRALGPGASMAALGIGERPVLRVEPPDAMPGKLLDAIDRLEKRILEIEHAPHPGPDALHPESETNGGPSVASPERAAAPTSEPELLEKAQSLLNDDKPADALACVEQVLARFPNHAEALVKKGSALERLRRNQEAVECYDQAIAADGTMTIAYLYKAGLFNRMERYTEALQCYEQALRSQES